jgi:fumarylacetoacetase
VALGRDVIAMAVLAERGLLPEEVPGEVFRRRHLNGLLELGPSAWGQTRARLQELITDGGEIEAALVPLDEVELLLPVRVGDYIDFYSSLAHAENAGRILRPEAPELPPAWRHLPIGYHGKAGTVVVSGTPVTRPWGFTGPGAFGPSTKLDFELEVGFVTGPGPVPPRPLSASEAVGYIFGVVLVNDWSARDLQAFEARPLGPFLGKSFATSISPWVVPVSALEGARTSSPTQDPPPAAHLRLEEPWGLDLDLKVTIVRGGQAHTVSSTSFAGHYWTLPQQLAHATSNGASFRAGDLFASGTVSGEGEGQRGSLLELTWGGAQPVDLAGGGRLGYLEDGDEVIMRGSATGVGGGRIDLGEVRGAIVPAAG